MTEFTIAVGTVITDRFGSSYVITGIRPERDTFTTLQIQSRNSNGQVGETPQFSINYLLAMIRDDHYTVTHNGYTVSTV